MKILNPQVEKDMATATPLKLDLGSGGPTKDDYYAIDCLALEGIDIVADLNQPIYANADNSVSHIRSRHALEHIDEFLPLMREIWRICQDDAVIDITVPHFSNPLAYSDPTHVRFFGLYTMFYFCSEDNQPSKRKVPSFYTDIRFEVETIKIQFYRFNLFDRIIVPILSRFINSHFYWQEMYEKRLSGIFRAWQITYSLRVCK